MAGKSKNSRTTSSAQQKTAVIGDVKLIVPCNGGKHAYMRDITAGTNPHMATDSVAFTEAVRANAAAGYGEKLRAEIASMAAERPQHAWGKVLADLEAADAFAA